MKTKLPLIHRSAAGAEITPVIVVDSREQLPLRFANLPAVGGTLQSGDYSIQGLEEYFAVERKSISDLVSCCSGDGRQRFQRELHRLRGFAFARLLIVGSREDIETGSYHSQIKPLSVLNSLLAWEVRYRVPAVFVPTPEAAAEQVESWALWFARESVLQINSLLRSQF